VTAGETLVMPALSRITPNPTNGPFSIEFALPRASNVSLRLVDPRGRVVANLSNGTQSAGRHRISWSGLTDKGSIAAGVYFVELRAEGVVRSQRVILAR
jgi:hypothetical protein